MRELSFDEGFMEPDDEFVRMEQAGQLDDNLFDSDNYDYADDQPDYDQEYLANADELDDLTYNGQPISGLNVDHIIDTPDAFEDFDDIILDD